MKLSQIVFSALTFGLASVQADTTGTTNLRSLVQGEGQIPCSSPPCSAPNFGNVDIQKLWVDHPNIFWRCQSPQMVALTFDDGPTFATAQIVNELDSLGVRATFFVNGNKIDDITGKLLGKIESRGHLIGHHTFTHANMVEDAQAKESGKWDQFLVMEIDQTKLVAAQYLQRGIRPYLRPPYTAMNKFMADKLQEKGIFVVQLSIDTKDYNKPDVNQMKSVFTNVIEDASASEKNSDSNSHISLQHDNDLTSLPIIRPVVKSLREAGFRFVTVDECLGYPEGENTPEPFKPKLPLEKLNWTCLGDPCESVEACRSSYGFCGVEDVHCNELSTWKAVCQTEEERNSHSCSGAACNFNSQCRSKWDECGSGDEYCNSDSTWTKACNSASGVTVSIAQFGITLYLALRMVL